MRRRKVILRDEYHLSYLCPFAAESSDEEKNDEKAPSDDEIDEAMEDDPVQKMDMSE